MAADWVQVQPDSTGKKLRTNTRTVGADTVHEQFIRRTPDTTYRTFTGEITVGTAIARTSVVTLWHPSTMTATVKVTKIMLHMRVGHTAGTFHVKSQFVTGENATPGGTLLTPQSLNRGSAASGLTVRQAPAAPTRAGQLLDDYMKMAAALSGAVQDSSYNLFKSEDGSEGITLRGGQAEGLEVSTDVLAALTGAPILVVGVEWTEEV